MDKDMEDLYKNRGSTRLEEIKTSDPMKDKADENIMTKLNLNEQNLIRDLALAHSVQERLVTYERYITVFWADYALQTNHPPVTKADEEACDKLRQWSQALKDDLSHFSKATDKIIFAEKAQILWGKLLQRGKTRSQNVEVYTLGIKQLQWWNQEHLQLIISQSHKLNKRQEMLSSSQSERKSVLLKKDGDEKNSEITDNKIAQQVKKLIEEITQFYLDTSTDLQGASFRLLPPPSKEKPPQCKQSLWSLYKKSYALESKLIILDVAQLCWANLVLTGKRDRYQEILQELTSWNHCREQLDTSREALDTPQKSCCSCLVM